MTDVDKVSFLMHKLSTEYVKILCAQPPDVLVDFNQVWRLLIRRIAHSLTHDGRGTQLDGIQQGNKSVEEYITQFVVQPVMLVQDFIEEPNF